MLKNSCKLTSQYRKTNPRRVLTRRCADESINSSRAKSEAKIEALWQCGVPVFFAFPLQQVSWVTRR
jgi:hypothetical protein